MKVSICIAAHNKPEHLTRVLNSIYRQYPPFPFEVIVIDDGSCPPLKDVVCCDFPIPFIRISRKPSYRNPSVPRNAAYRLAKGEIIIAQSDDTEHQGNAIATLVKELQPNQFVIANVFNFNLDGTPAHCHGNWHELTGPRGRAKRPLFFLGALWRKDLYAIGGNDEEFTEPGREDIWFGECLTEGLKLTPHFSTQAVGHHLHHDRPADLRQRSRKSRELCRQKVAQAQRTGPWQSSGGPWPYTPAVALASPPLAG